MLAEAHPTLTEIYLIMKTSFKFFSTLLLSFFFTVVAFAIEKNSVVITASKDKDLVTVTGEQDPAYFALKKIVGTNCGDQISSDEINFFVGKQKFKAKHNDIIHETSFLQKINISKKLDSDFFEYSMPKTIGCKTNPATYLAAAFNINNDKNALLYIVEKDNGENVSKYIKFLNSEKLCKTTQHDLVIACYGSKTVNNVKISVIFLIPLEDGSKSPFNGETQVPVHAQCEGRNEQDLVCNVNEYFTKNYMATIQISRDKLSKNEILATRAQIKKSLNSMISN
jgi:hypothetical protein